MSPLPTSNGVASTIFSSSPAVRTNVVHSKPNSASHASSMAFSMDSREPVASNTTLPLLMWVNTSA